MSALNKLETQLATVLDKKSPVKLPPNGRKGLAHAMWWIALIVGILDLWAAYALWHLGHTVDRLVNYANNLSNYYGVPNYASATTHLGLFYYLAVLAIALVAVLLLVATPGLKAMKKQGWNLLFYGLLVDVVVAIVRLFSDVGGGVGNFIWSLITLVVGAWLLFQVRDYFTGAKVATSTAAHHQAHEVHESAHGHESKK